MKTQVIIIGAGPAGIAAAIQLKRLNIDFLLIEKEQVGGLLANAYLVENLPAIANGVSGTKLIEMFRKQLEKFDIPVIDDEIRSVIKLDSSFQVEGNRVYFGNYVIMATGTKAINYDWSKFFKIDEADSELRNRFYHEVKHIRSIIKEKVIAIIGSGDAAFDYALSMSESNEVAIFIRGNKAKANMALMEKVINTESIGIYLNHCLTEADYSDSGIHLHFENSFSFACEYVIAAIGREAEIPPLFNDSMKEINIEKHRIDGLYIIGDVANGLYRQASIAFSDGIKAAMEINFNLMKYDNKS